MAHNTPHTDEAKARIGDAQRARWARYHRALRLQNQAEDEVRRLIAYLLTFPAADQATDLELQRRTAEAERLLDAADEAKRAARS